LSFPRTNPPGSRALANAAAYAQGRGRIIDIVV
jgi:hypothetical protein